MPQIPVYHPGQTGGMINTGGGLSYAPGGSGFDPTVVERAAGAFVQAAGTYAKIQQQLRAEDEKLDLEVNMNRLKNNMAQRQADLQRAQLDPQTQLRHYQWPGAVYQALEQETQAAVANLKYPDSAKKFLIHAMPYISAQQAAAQHQSIQMQMGEISVAQSIAQREDANTAVFATDQDTRNKAISAGTQRITDLLRAGVWSKDKAESELKAFLGQVEEGNVRRDAKDPTKFNQVIGNLTNGRYQLPPDDQLKLKDQLIAQARTEREQARQDKERENAAVSDAAEKNIVDAVVGRNKELALHYYRLALPYMKSGEEARGWMDWINKEDAGKSDETTLRYLEGLMYNADTPQQIAKARLEVIKNAKMLSTSDARTLMGHGQSLAIAARNRAEDRNEAEQHRIHGEVKALVQESLRVTGPLEKIVPEAQDTLDKAMSDLFRNRANAAEWWRANETYYKARVTQAAAQRLNSLRRDVRYPDEQSLMRALPTLKPEEASRQLRLFRQYIELSEEIERLRGKAPTQGGQSTTGKSLGYQ